MECHVCTTEPPPHVTLSLHTSPKIHLTSGSTLQHALCAGREWCWKLFHCSRSQMRALGCGVEKCPNAKGPGVPRARSAAGVCWHDLTRAPALMSRASSVGLLWGKRSGSDPPGSPKSLPKPLVSPGMALGAQSYLVFSLGRFS